MRLSYKDREKLWAAEMQGSMHKERDRETGRPRRAQRLTAAPSFSSSNSKWPTRVFMCSCAVSPSPTSADERLEQEEEEERRRKRPRYVDDEAEESDGSE